jgi:hypothetical protein
MIPIRFRLSDRERKKYIDKIILLFKDEFETVKFSNRIKYLLMLMKKRGYTRSRFFEMEARKYKREYPSQYYFCMWLVLTYEEIDDIIRFIREKFIEKDLMKISKYMIRYKKKEIKNYSDLNDRRGINYTNQDIKIYVNKKIFYDIIYKCFSKFKEIYIVKFSKENINNWIIDKTQVKVCPYCNLAYTYNRGMNTTAQLDHFFSKAEYPMFSLCFYNMIPSCPACNHIKSDKQNEMISPYKENAFKDLKISWEYSNCGSGGIKYNNKKSLTNLEKDIKIILKPSCIGEKNNIELMNIEDAYNQHKDYATEIVKKVRIFSNKDSQKLIIAMGRKVGIKTSEVERFYLGNYVDEKQLGKRILSKLTSDFYKEYMEYMEYIKRRGK